MLFPQQAESDVQKTAAGYSGQLERFVPLNMWGDHYLLSRICLHRQFRIAAMMRRFDGLMISLMVRE